MFEVRASTNAGRADVASVITTALRIIFMALASIPGTFGVRTAVHGLRSGMTLI
jgi:hypothetical protein